MDANLDNMSSILSLKHSKYEQIILLMTNLATVATASYQIVEVICFNDECNTVKFQNEIAMHNSLGHIACHLCNLILSLANSISPTTTTST